MYHKPVVRLLVTGVIGWLVLVGGSPSAAGARWQTFPACTLVDHDSNDADSFIVRAGDETIHLRLYFVDAPESFVGTDADAKRVRAQARHFGLADPTLMLDYGRAATRAVKEQLAQPFTVRTTFASALGRSRTRRVYGLVETAAGDDLGAWLAQNGFARVYGVRRSLPDGTHRDEAVAHLEDLEVLAMLKRVGVWAATDPEAIVALREEQRNEDRAEAALRTQLQSHSSLQAPVNINTAHAYELQRLSGIGPVLASRIIEKRPYAIVDDLKRVTGISDRLLERLRPHLVVQTK